MSARCWMRRLINSMWWFPMPEGRSILSKAGRGAVVAFFIFVLFGLWQFIAFEMRPVDDFYQPRGYISKVNDLIQERKIYLAPQKMKEGYRPVVEIIHR